MLFYRYVLFVTSSLTLTGCFNLGGLQGDAATTFIGAASKPDQIVKDLLQARSVAYSEERFSLESYGYLRPNFACKNKDGSLITIESEERLQKYRIEALDTLKDYIQQLKENLKPSDDVATANALIDAASGLAGVIGGAYAPGSAAAATAAAKALKAAVVAGDEARRAIAIGRLAQAHAEQIKRISSNLERDVRPINDEINTRLNLWETCEFQKLIYIQQADNSSLIEKEARYRVFYDVKAKLKAQISGAIDAEDAIKKLPQLHDAFIAATKSVPNNLAELQKIAGQIGATVDAFDAAVVAAKALR